MKNQASKIATKKNNIAKLMFMKMLSSILSFLGSKDTTKLNLLLQMM